MACFGTMTAKSLRCTPTNTITKKETAPGSSWTSPRRQNGATKGKDVKIEVSGRKFTVRYSNDKFIVNDVEENEVCVGTVTGPKSVDYEKNDLPEVPAYTRRSMTTIIMNEFKRMQAQEEAAGEEKKAKGGKTTTKKKTTRKPRKR